MLAVVLRGRALALTWRRGRSALCRGFPSAEGTTFICNVTDYAVHMGVFKEKGDDKLGMLTFLCNFFMCLTGLPLGDSLKRRAVF